MLASYFYRLLLIAAGLGCGAFMHSALLWNGASILRAFVVHFTGGMFIAAPLALGSLWFAKNALSNGMFYAGLSLAIAPLLASWLPLELCLAAGLVVAITLCCKGNGTATTHLPKFATLCTAVFHLLLVIGLWIGGTYGRPEVSQDLPTRAGAAPQSPDVLLISIDTLRSDVVINPPAGLDFKSMQKLAREGISAPYALSSSGLTLPGHTSMLTGLDSLEHGVRDNFDPIPDGLPWLAKDFLAAGYHTAGVISNGLLSRDIGFGEGFEIYDDSEVPIRGDIRRFASSLAESSWVGAALPQSKLIKAVDKPLFRAYRTHQGKSERGRAARTNEHALEFVDKLLEDDRPYFFFLHYLDPHDPYGTIAPFDMLLEQDISSHTEIDVDASHGVTGETAIEIEKVLQSGDAVQRDVAIEQIKFMRRRYMEEIMFTDQCISEVLDTIAKGGRDTIVILTADHGEHFGEHNLMKHGNSLYKENIRVPFFMSGPGIPRATRTEQQIQLIDIAPTLLDLCGIETEREFRGINIVDLANANQQIERQHIAIDGNFFCVIIGKQKYIARWDKEAGLILGDGLGLFNLSEDRGELNPSADIPAHFKDAIEAALERDSYQSSRQRSEFQIDMGHQLGYTGE